MKTIPLRKLMREPTMVKKWTKAGQAVSVTDNGEPLWVIHPAEKPVEDEDERRRGIEEVFAEVMREPQSKISLSKIIKDSRR